MVASIITNIFLNRIFIIVIDSIAVFLAVLVVRGDPKGQLNRLYLIMTALMLGWVNFAYIPRVIDPVYYAYGVLSLKIAWLVTPLFFLFLYFLSVNLAEKAERFRMLTLATALVGTIVSLVSGFTNHVIAGFQVVSGVTTIVYGDWKIPFLIGITFIIVAMLVPLFDQGSILKNKKLQAFSVGLLIFLVLNAIFNITLPMFLGVSRFYFLGDYSTLILLAFIAYAITNHQLFDTQVIAAEMLTLFIWVGIFVQLLLGNSLDERLLAGGTLVFAVIFGLFLIRSVKREIAERKEIEALATELEATNTRQENLIHFIGHEVKGFLTKAQGVFSLLHDGDLGALPDSMRPFVDRALADTEDGVRSVSDILKAANLKRGTVEFKKEPLDLKTVAAESVQKVQEAASAKSLALSFTADDGAFPFEGDAGEIADHVLRNLIDNAVAYTPSGSVAVSLKKAEGKYVFAVKDTGVGITPEDRARLFTEGGHGKDSIKVNVHSTGYGLYIAKQVVEAHGGTIRADSDGAGHGSTFTVEFPADSGTVASTPATSG